MDDYFTFSSTPKQAASQQPAPYPAAPPMWVPPQPGPGTSTGVKVLIGVAIAFGSLVVLGILAAIAIPVFLNERAKSVSAHTYVTMPESAAGLALRTDVAAAAMAQRLKDIPVPGDHLAGAYGGTTLPEALVTVTKRYMSPSDQRGYLVGSESGAQRTGAGAVASFSDVDPGSLGGRVRCSSTARVTACFFVDAGAYGSILVFGSPDRGAELVPQLRAAVEHRT